MLRLRRTAAHKAAAWLGVRVQHALAKIGAEPAGGTPEEFGRLIGDQVAHWKTVVAKADMKVQP